MVWGRVKVNSPGKLASFLDSPDDVYGSGADLDATISTNSTMSSDMYYYNLTVNSSITLNTGGYRLFVKNVLTMGASSVIGLPGGSTAVGTLKAGGVITANTTCSLGGNGNTDSSADGGTATAPTAVQGGTSYWRYPSQAIRGYAVTASATTPTYLEGGAGGPTGQGVGGGVVIIAARYISTAGACTISATGGAQAGGGAIIFFSSNDEATFNAQTHLSLSAAKGSGSGNHTDGTAIYVEVD
jgi:hypothetical protein